MKTYLIAELGSTHDGSLGNALRMVEVFAGLGASAIKLQDHRGQHAYRADHPPWFQGSRALESREEYLRRTEFTTGDILSVMELCNARGVHLIVSPFSVEAAKSAPCHAFKVASGQVTNHELLRELVRIGKPVHLSSGMTTRAEQDAAVEILFPVLASVMRCVSEYPTPPHHWPMRELWDASVGITSKHVSKGYSDHSGGIIAPLLAVWEGAEVLEVHVTLSRDMYGSDARHSLEPAQFAELVAGIKQVEAARDSTVTRDERVALLAETRKQFLHGA